MPNIYFANKKMSKNGKYKQSPRDLAYAALNLPFISIIENKEEILEKLKSMDAEKLYKIAFESIKTISALNEQNEDSQTNSDGFLPINDDETRQLIAKLLAKLDERGKVKPGVLCQSD